MMVGQSLVRTNSGSEGYRAENLGLIPPLQDSHQELTVLTARGEKKETQLTYECKAETESAFGETQPNVTDRSC